MFFASLHATRVVLCVWSPVGGQTEKTCNVSSIIYSSFNLCWSGRVCDGWIRPASFLTRLVLTLTLPPIVWIFFLPSFSFSFFFVTKNKQKDEPPEITYCVVNQNGMMHLQTLSPAQPMPEESELDAKFTELLVIVFFFWYFLFFLGCEMFLVDYFPEWISSDLRFPPLMIDGVFFIIIYLRRCFADICVAVVYTPMLSRIFIQRWCDDDICPTFFRRV